jgi:hypothetical protein
MKPYSKDLRMKVLAAVGVQEKIFHRKLKESGTIARYRLGATQRGEYG